MIRGLLKFFFYGHSHSAPWLLSALGRIRRGEDPLAPVFIQSNLWLFVPCFLLHLTPGTLESLDPFKTYDRYK